jgi:hypothetical protein
MLCVYTDVISVFGMVPFKRVTDLILFVCLFFQILGICFAQNLRADIFAQKAKWHWQLRASTAV